MDIKKVSGEYEVFQSDKLCQSLELSGAPKDLASYICKEVSSKVQEGMPSSRLWRLALSYLKKEDIKASAVYSLARGMSGLGPSGFLFESFVEAVLQVHGYYTKRGVMVKGKSGIDHEIDVIAQQTGMRAYVEVKYKNQHGLKTHIDHIMYAYARFEDIIDRIQVITHDIKYESWVITNTKFTGHARKYGKYRDMKLIGWHYPKKGNLSQLIIEKNLWPVTVLPSVNDKIKKNLTDKGIILAQDLITFDANYIREVCGTTSRVADNILREVHELIST